MQPRQDVVEIFSTFLRLEADRVTGWTVDRRLQRNMAALVPAAPQLPPLWALHWHQVWQRSQSLAEAQPAEGHLSAYLQETGYWVARKMARNQRQPGWIGDLFQVAMLRVPKLLKHFKPQYSESLKKYAELVFENSLKDWLRAQQQIEVCTDWALLYRLSRKRLVAALQGAGWSQPRIAQATLAWECFQELAVNQTAMNALSRPSALTWQAIAAAYNAERLSQVGPGTPLSDPEQIEQWLLTCAKLVRQFLKPDVVSADAPKPGQEVSYVDTLAETKLPPIDLLLQQEADTIRQQQRLQLQEVLVNALITLSKPEISLLQHYYRDQLTQTEIAKQLGTQQFNVSRDLKRIRRALLKKVAQWSQATLHISLTPPVVDAMTHTVEAWLRAQFKGDEEVKG